MKKTMEFITNILVTILILAVVVIGISMLLARIGARKDAFENCNMKEYSAYAEVVGITKVRGIQTNYTLKFDDKVEITCNEKLISTNDKRGANHGDLIPLDVRDYTDKNTGELKYRGFKHQDTESWSNSVLPFN